MLAIGSDHGGFALKQAVMKHLEARGIAYRDYGTYTADSCDYPEYGRAVALAVAGALIEPSVGAAAAIVCATAIWFSRYISLGAVLGAVILIITSVLVVENQLPMLLLIGCAVLVLVRHLPALRRISRGQEERLSFKEDLTYKLDSKF